MWDRRGSMLIGGGQRLGLLPTASRRFSPKRELRYSRQPPARHTSLDIPSAAYGQQPKWRIRWPRANGSQPSAVSF